MHQRLFWSGLEVRISELTMDRAQKCADAHQFGGSDLHLKQLTADLRLLPAHGHLFLADERLLRANAQRDAGGDQKQETLQYSYPNHPMLITETCLLKRAHSFRLYPSRAE
jgi:hypothetical protein